MTDKNTLRGYFKKKKNPFNLNVGDGNAVLKYNSMLGYCSALDSISALVLLV